MGPARFLQKAYIGSSDSYGSSTQPIYWDDGVPKAVSYSINATINSGTATRLAYYSAATTVSSTPNISYINAINSTAATPVAQNGLRIWGPTIGNTAANMVGGTKGVFSYGDAGPQIQFGTSAGSNQDGALIFTDHDSAGGNASWHFVTNQNDWVVTSKRFHARTSLSAGTDLPQTGYNLYVNGTDYFNIGTSDTTGAKNFVIYGYNRYLSFGASGFQAYTGATSTDTPSKLYLQYNGGTMDIGCATATANTTLYGSLTLYREGETDNDVATALYFYNKDTTTGKNYTGAWIAGYQDHYSTPSGLNMVIKPGGNLFVGSGEGPQNLYNTIGKNSTTENLYATADTNVYIYANADTIANRIGFQVTTAGNIVPVKAEAANDNAQSLGTTDNRWRANFSWFQGVQKGAEIYSSDSSKPWVKAMTWTGDVKDAADDTTINLSVSHHSSPNSTGILHISIRWIKAAASPQFVRAIWTSGSSINPNNYVITYKKDSSNKIYFSLYVKLNADQSVNITKLNEHAWGFFRNEWELSSLSGSVGVASLPTNESQVVSSIGSAYIHGNGSIHWNNLVKIGDQDVVTTDINRGLPRILANSVDVNLVGRGSKFWGMSPSSVTLESTSNSGSSWTTHTVYTTDAQKRGVTNGAGQMITVGNLTYDSGSGNTTTVTVGQGVRITLDFQVENRFGYVECLVIPFYTRGQTCSFIIERWNKNTDTWTTIETGTLTDTNQNRVIYPSVSWYMNGNTSTATANYANKLRVTMIVIALGTASRYAPAIHGIYGYGAAVPSHSRSATYPSGRLFDITVAQHGLPMLIGDRSAGRLDFPISQLYIRGVGGYHAANSEVLAYLTLGNSYDISGANEHAEGRIWMFSAATKAHIIRGTSTDTDYNHYFPNSTGWIATGGNGTTTGVGGESLPVYMDTTGVITAIKNIDLPSGSFISVKNIQISQESDLTRGVFDRYADIWMINVNADGTSTYIPNWASKGSNTRPIYIDDNGEAQQTSYLLKATVNNATQYGVAYYSTTTNITSTAAGAANTALMGKGSAAPAFVSVSTTLATSTAATASASQKLKVTVLGVASSEVELSKATTALYGTTKLTDAYTSTDDTLAATGKSILAAIQTLDVDAVDGSGTKFVTKISETNGKISATLSSSSVGSSERVVYLSSGTITAGNKVWTLQGGTAFTSGEDFNDKTTFGNYYVNTSSIGNTLLHNPYSDSASTSVTDGVLKVSSSLGGTSTAYIRQDWFKYNTPEHYVRFKNGSSANWGAWKTYVWKDSNGSTAAGGSTTAPVYINSAGKAIAITSVGVTHGGTGTTTAPTAGGVIYAASTSSYASTGAGTAGQFLMSQGAAAPVWSSTLQTGSFVGTNSTVYGLIYHDNTDSYNNIFIRANYERTHYYQNSKKDKEDMGFGFIDSTGRWMGTFGYTGSSSPVISSSYGSVATYMRTYGPFGDDASHASFYLAYDRQYATAKAVLSVGDTATGTLGDVAEIRKIYLEDIYSERDLDGYCVIDTPLGYMKLSSKRMQPNPKIISNDFAIGLYTDKGRNNNIAIAGRKKAYPIEDVSTLSIGDCFCSAANGHISKMTQEEKIQHPECIVGTLSEIPENYEENENPYVIIWIR